MDEGYQIDYVDEPEWGIIGGASGISTLNRQVPTRIRASVSCCARQTRKSPAA
jgi:hypothetical protein